MRLDRFFTSQSLASRREVAKLIKSGRITINGLPAKAPDIPIDPKCDIVSLDGSEIVYKPYLYLMLNKPKGVVSATEDKQHRTVLDLVPPELYRKGLFPAGRLDRDTEGFVLLTDDGDFAHRILSPKKHVPKTYQAVLDRPVDDSDVAAFANGIVLADGTVCMPAGLRALEDCGGPAAEIILREGKYHQVKRMFEARGKRVLALKRIKIGGLSLDRNLAPGQCREILHKERDKILES